MRHFLHDTEDRTVLRACLLQEGTGIACPLVQRHLAAHKVQVKVRYGRFPNARAADYAPEPDYGRPARLPASLLPSGAGEVGVMPEVAEAS